MIPRSFEYYSPRTLDEAVALLQKLGPEAKLLSGGQSLIPMMKLRLLSPEYIVDINRIPNLDYITESDGHLKIGALAREHELESSDVVKQKFPILADTAKVIADPLVRSQATICGNLAHGDPANDHPATMLALGVTVVATGPNGQREVLLHHLPTLTTPTLVVWGGCDYVLPAYHAQAAVNHLPNGRLSSKPRRTATVMPSGP